MQVLTRGVLRLDGAFAVNDLPGARRVRIARLEVQYAQIRVLPVSDPSRPEIIKRFFEAIRLGGIKTVGGYILPGQGMTTVDTFRAYLDGGGR